MQFYFKQKIINFDVADFFFKTCSIRLWLNSIERRYKIIRGILYIYISRNQ